MRFLLINYLRAKNNLSQLAEFEIIENITLVNCKEKNVIYQTLYFTKDKMCHYQLNKAYYMV